jgi:hypothetical protein
MKKFVLARTFTVLLGSARALADTQTFHAYGAAMLPEQRASMNIGPSVAFPGFTLYSTGLGACRGEVRSEVQGIGFIGQT